MMMINRIVALVVVTAASAVGCTSATNLSEADSYAVAACGIEIDTETGEANYSGYSDTAINAYDETQSKVLAWRDNAENASSAAARDSRFEPLRESSLTIYRLKDEAVKTWQRVRPSTDAFFRSFTDSDIDEHNNAIDEWNVECSSFSKRLNSGT